MLLINGGDLYGYLIVCQASYLVLSCVICVPYLALTSGCFLCYLGVVLPCYLSEGCVRYLIYLVEGLTCYLCNYLVLVGRTRKGGIQVGTAISYLLTLLGEGVTC